MKVARLIGGAGTGKTTELLQIMNSVMEQIGHDPSAIGFASFTKAAREEMVSRASESFGCHSSLLDKHGWFRTVHSTCYRMLECKNDQMLSADDKASQWVADRLRVKVSWKKVADSGYSACVGDTEAAASLTLWDVSRSRIEPLAYLHASKANAGLEVPPMATVRHFVKKYEDAKRLDGKYDFVDILGRYAGVRFGLEGPEDVEPEGALPPGVKVWIFDEAQDSSSLVDRVCRRLAYADGVQWAYLAADPFQSVFGFGGADYKNFLSWDVDKERTMPQSWRCPKPVMELGEKCLKRMKQGYFDRGISPASHDGKVIREPSIERAIGQMQLLAEEVLRHPGIEEDSARHDQRAGGHDCPHGVQCLLEAPARPGDRPRRMEGGDLLDARKGYRGRYLPQAGREGSLDERAKGRRRLHRRRRDRVPGGSHAGIGRADQGWPLGRAARRRESLVQGRKSPRGRYRHQAERAALDHPRGEGDGGPGRDPVDRDGRPRRAGAGTGPSMPRRGVPAGVRRRHQGQGTAGRV